MSTRKLFRIRKGALIDSNLMFQPCHRPSCDFSWLGHTLSGVLLQARKEPPDPVEGSKRSCPEAWAADRLRFQSFDQWFFRILLSSLMCFYHPFKAFPLLRPSLIRFWLVVIIGLLLIGPSTAIASTFLRWTQSDGIGMAGGGLVSQGSFVNQYNEATSPMTVLSQGLVEQVRFDGAIEQTVNYRVSLFSSAALFYNEADDRTNNAFVIHADGQADWYNAIKGAGTVELLVEFFEIGSAFGTPEAVSLSLTSPHVQPDTVDPLADDVKRLHQNEVYDVQFFGSEGTPTRSFTDTYNQLQQSIQAPTGYDFSLGWAAPGFGNDTNLDGNLDVGEALFTFDLSAANAFLISRSGDNGKRSAMGLTAEGFFGGTPQPIPEPSTALLLALGLMGLASQRRALP